MILVSGWAEPLVVFGSLPPFPRPLPILLHNYWFAGEGRGGGEAQENNVDKFSQRLKQIKKGSKKAEDKRLL